MAAVYEHLRKYFDPAIQNGDTMNDLKNRPKLAEFFEAHVKRRHYFFSIKKCDNCDVCFEKRLLPLELHHLPDPVVSESDSDHYKAFQVIF